MKYMILVYASQQDFDRMVDKENGWDQAKVAEMHEFMTKLNQELADSGELVETQGLQAPVHTRRIQLRGGVPVVTDGPYAETQEVLAGYWIVECASFDRATEIAAKATLAPDPSGTAADRSVIDVRPVIDSIADLEL